jgi:hypothetical protein
MLAQLAADAVATHPSAERAAELLADAKKDLAECDAAADAERARLRALNGDVSALAEKRAAAMRRLNAINVVARRRIDCLKDAVKQAIDEQGARARPITSPKRREPPAPARAPLLARYRKAAADRPCVFGMLPVWVALTLLAALHLASAREN